MNLSYDQGGEGERLLVLLHGLGAARAVWQPMLARKRWHGRWIAPDLRGHGASAHDGDYSLDAHAGDVAALVAGHDVTVLGHSMGGAVGLALAHRIRARVFGLGIKVAWSAGELAGLDRIANAPVRYFASRDEAVARYRKVSGAVDDSGVAEDEQGWRLAADPATAKVGPPPMERLMAGVEAHLARGERDPMVSLAQLQVYDASAVDIAGAGHSAMIEAPDAMWDWLLQ
ncbi:MAG TPA: alpha/beta hydrolase [Rhizomicrobium sp.]|jgi:pimeloyl-ACP methyl ester carboxylesterase